MNFTKLNKQYVSEIDRFLVEFDKQNPKRSVSQLREVQKSGRVSRLMKDVAADTDSEKSDLWDKF
jgi:hypothetical protein